MAGFLGSKAVVITAASAGRFRPRSMLVVSRASPVVARGTISLRMLPRSALPLESTAAAISDWPAEFTTAKSSFRMKVPLRV